MVSIASLFIRQERLPDQKDVVCKTAAAELRPGASASITQTCAGAELLFARLLGPAPTSQTSAAECFRSRAEVLFARLRRRCFRSRSFCCWRFRSAAAGCFCAVPPPVIGIAGPPLPRAVAAYLAVFGVGGDLLPVIIGAALALANRLAADRLRRLKLRRLKGLLTIAATPFTHTGVVASRCPQNTPD